MSQLTFDQALRMAVQYHQSGQLREAESLYRQLLAHDPKQTNALDMLGVLLAQSGRIDEGIQHIRRSLEISPLNAASLNNLGNLLQSTGQLDEAIATFRRALSHTPNDPTLLSNLGVALASNRQWSDAVASFEEALRINPAFHAIYGNLGNALKGLGQPEKAIAAFHKAIAFNPQNFEAHNNLGNVFHAQGKISEAIAAYSEAIRINPSFADAHYNLGNIFKQRQQLPEAIAAYRQALHFKPNYPDALVALANALRDSGQIHEAIALYRKALEFRPNDAETHNNLGVACAAYGAMPEAIAAYRESIRLNPANANAHNNLANVFNTTGNLDEALATLREALKLSPNLPELHCNLGALLKDIGGIPEAIACFREALRLKPNFPEAHSNLIYALHFDSATTTQTLADELRHFREQHADPLKSFIQTPTNDRTRARRLRIAYVSPDLREHVVARFLLPLLAAHNRAEFEVFCYSDVLAPDAMTERLKSAADHWRSIAGISNAQAADLIRGDKIDILIDLAMHTSRNRLLLFARKPAPVQATWLAYPGSTGLNTINYRLTDSHLETPDAALYPETPMLLPETYWCYHQTAPTPDVNALPFQQNNYITFGCLNNFGKMSDAALRTWARILQALPSARLLLNGGAQCHRTRVLDILFPMGINPNRIDFLGKGNYFNAYQKIDIALDPFPYVGATTTCDALWMGVPVITLGGKTAVGRSGISILSNLSLHELIAQNEDDYMHRALTLANDPARLATLRATIRDRMLSSPLMDIPRFAKNIDTVYRHMWQNWCVE